MIWRIVPVFSVSEHLPFCLSYEFLLFLMALKPHTKFCSDTGILCFSVVILVSEKSNQFIFIGGTVH